MYPPPPLGSRAISIYYDTDEYLPIYMTYELENHLQILPYKGRGIQKAIVKYGDLRGHAVFANNEARELLLNAKVWMPETLALNPVWLSHMSDKLKSSFGDEPPALWCI